MLVFCLYVLVCTRVLLVCTCMLLVCTRMYSCGVLVTINHLNLISKGLVFLKQTAFLSSITRGKIN